MARSLMVAILNPPLYFNNNLDVQTQQNLTFFMVMLILPRSVKPARRAQFV